MKVLIAPDKFKDSLDASQVCDAIEAGILLFNGNIETIKFPMADGGNGTAEILTRQNKGRKIKVRVNDPLLRKIEAEYGISGNGETAYIEMAAASGLELLNVKERDCLLTSTFGTGELIMDALQKGVKSIILGIGGSATNDAGMGMASALGFQFLDQHGNFLEPVGKNLVHVREIIDTGNVEAIRNKLSLRAACDVDNPMFGLNGAAYIYAAQKGANKEAIRLLDDGLRNFSEILKSYTGQDVSEIPGSGAAGAMGAGIIALLKGELVSGVSLVLDETGFDNYAKEVDLIITGEGRIDEQTLKGKVIHGICRRVQPFNIPVAALTGSLMISPEQLRPLQLCYAASIVNRPMELNDAIEESYKLISDASFHLISLFCKGRIL